MPTSDLEAVGDEENAPMPLSSLSPIVPLPGLHMNPEPGEDLYVQSPSAYDSGENFRRMSVPSSIRQGSHSCQGSGSRANTKKKHGIIVLRRVRIAFLTSTVQVIQFSPATSPTFLNQTLLS